MKITSPECNTTAENCTEIRASQRNTFYYEYKLRKKVNVPFICIFFSRFLIEWFICILSNLGASLVWARKTLDISRVFLGLEIIVEPKRKRNKHKVK